jgi:choline dehydrogenase-like flavoprotein
LFCHELSILRGSRAARLSAADASIMPTLVRGTLTLPIMMIAERAADLLLAGAGARPEASMFG